MLIFTRTAAKHTPKQATIKLWYTNIQGYNYILRSISF